MFFGTIPRHTFLMDLKKEVDDRKWNNDAKILSSSTNPVINTLRQNLKEVPQKLNTVTLKQLRKSIDDETLDLKKRDKIDEVEEKRRQTAEYLSTSMHTHSMQQFSENDEVNRIYKTVKNYLLQEAKKIDSSQHTAFDSILLSYADRAITLDDSTPKITPDKKLSPDKKSS